jgi:SAM-dependent methyltransferase
MPSDPPFDATNRRDKTVRIVKSGLLRADSEDPVERYTYHFVQLIERHLSLPDRPLLGLDLACGDGFPTLTLWPQLPEGSRVIAIGDDRAELRLFHEQVAPDLRNVLFPRKERTDRLPFADGVFDTVWAALVRGALDPLKPSLRQALRVLRPGGQLQVAAPLRDTFADLASRLGALLDAKQQGEAFRSLMTDPPDLLDLDAWQEAFGRCGAVRIEAHKDRIAISIDPPLSSDRLFTRHLLPLWLGNDPTLQARALRLLDEHITDPITVEVYLACVTGVRGEAYLQETSVSR